MNKVLFLPTGYQAPKTTNYYMKFEDGENKFRILSQPIIGWEDWIDKKPVRFKMDSKPQRSIDPKKPIKHFWSMIVWNYALEEIQILHLTQASIRKVLEALCIDADWGAPYFYDLKVIKTGKDLETEYTLNPLPHKTIASHIQGAFNERPCNLEAIFTNDDPFSKNHDFYTAGIFSQSDVASSTNKMTPNVSLEEAYDLEMILDECDAKYKTWVFNHIKKQYNTESLADLPVEAFIKIKIAAVKNMEANHAKQRENTTPDFLEGLAQ